MDIDDNTKIEIDDEVNATDTIISLFKQHLQDKPLSKDTVNSFNPLSIDKDLIFRDLHNIGKSSISLVKFSFLITYTDSEVYYSYVNKKLNKFIENDFDHIDENESFLGERNVLNVKPIPGLSINFFRNAEDRERYYILDEYNILVYDYSENNFKVSRAIESYGIVYINHNQKIITFHSFKSAEFNLPPVSIQQDKISLIRSMIKTELSLILNTNEDHVIEFILISMLSKTIRKQVKILCYLPINIFNISKSLAESLSNFLKNIFPITIAYDISINSLNSANIIPTFDSTEGKLSSSLFQFSNNTLLLLDETSLDTGKLETKGCENVNFLNNLIENQIETYVFPYNPGVEIEVSCAVIVLSSSKTILSNSIILVKFPKSDNDIMKTVPIDDNKYKDFTNYFNHCCSIINEDSVLFSDDISALLTKDFVEERSLNPSFTGEDFSRLITMSSLYALSFGRSTLTYEDYIFIKALDKKRIAKIIN